MVQRYLLHNLVADLGQFPAVAITGARQAGKTTLARSIHSAINSPVLYLDLELPTDIAKLQEPELFLREYEDHCVILDEIHHMPDLFPVLRGLIDEHRRPGRFLILGSASPALLRDSSESLAGRISYNKLYPLNVVETENEIDLKTHLLRGGFPDSLLTSSDSKSNRWRTNFIQTYLARELPSLGLTSDVRILRKLLTMLCHVQSSVLNVQSLSNSLGVTRPTVSRYIDFLEKSYIVTRVEPWFSNVKKRLVKSPKIYISDSGIFHSLLGITDYPGLIEHPAVGASWEGFVIQQTSSILPPDMDLWFFRTHEGAEADIVLSKNDSPIASAEIKWTNAPKLSKGFRNVVGYLKSEHNYVITPASDTYPAAENIKVISLLNWLDVVSQLHGGEKK
ncbi:MAG: AAA family ATPase [Bacteroidetes bacterium]|jgi:predicted AAA+ superfamily ATPase|nr:AAA family ATPase [Bacteroidota bacterium]